MNVNEIDEIAAVHSDACVDDNDVDDVIFKFITFHIIMHMRVPFFGILHANVEYRNEQTHAKNISTLDLNKCLPAVRTYRCQKS